MVADRYFEREEAVAARAELGIDEFSDIAARVVPRAEQWQSGCGGPVVYCGQCGGVTEPNFLYEGQVRARVCTVCKHTCTVEAP